MPPNNEFKIVAVALMIFLWGCANPEGMGKSSSSTGSIVAGGASTDSTSSIPNPVTTGNAADGGGSGGVLFGSATDSSSILDCKIDPTSEKCKQAVERQAPVEEHCTADLTPVRLVYWQDVDVTQSPPEELAWNPLKYSSSPLTALRKGCVDAAVALRAKYRDYCFKLNDDGTVSHDRDWSQLGFDPSPAVYFVKPKEVPLATVSSHEFTSLDDFKALFDKVDQEKIEMHMYVSFTELKNAAPRVPGKRELFLSDSPTTDFQCPKPPTKNGFNYSTPQTSIGETIQQQEKDMHVPEPGSFTPPVKLP